LHSPVFQEVTVPNESTKLSEAGWTALRMRGMRRLFVALALVSSAALAAASNPTDVIATRSGLPASEVDAALSHCDAKQMSMNLCAWRVQIVAEQKLKQVVKGKAAVSATCKAALEKRLTTWRKRRDANCEKSASQEWGGGSMLATAVAMCKTVETERMSKAIGSAICR
jgi:uncharacterized protein YecT (DUF1311 family)